MNRMTRWDPVCCCYKAVRDQEQGRSVIQELGVYESIHEEEIEKAVNIGDIRDMYFTGAAQLDPYWENFGKPKTERSGWIPVSVLDKIRAEIERHHRKTQGIDPYDLVGDCLDIIDKYKAESEDKQ